MKEISLPEGVWWFDPQQPLGPGGGFGTVYAGIDQEDNPVAVKELHVDATDTAHRELRIADSLKRRSLDYVLPIYDAGLDAHSDRYYVVMPRAEFSLQDRLQANGAFEDTEVISILLSIARGLTEVQDITHRDLKPGNILYHADRWKIADFGISRFVEESTSVQTLKGAMTPHYAAPEQFRFERATSATDIYALGCIAYVLLTGSPPFIGHSWEDYADAHCHQSPPALPTHHTPVLRNLLSMMLRKPSQSRPSLSRVVSILENIERTFEASTGLQQIAQAAIQVAEFDAQRETTEEVERSESQRRRELHVSALDLLAQSVEDLAERILHVAPNGIRNSTRGAILILSLGTSTLDISLINPTTPIPRTAFSQSGWDVVSGAVIRIRQAQPEYEWSANLWYLRPDGSSEYRWMEIDYMTHPLARQRRRFEPFAVTNIEDADRAASRSMDTIQFASQPRPIDDENIEDFIDRWADRFASACRGNLRKPSSLPYS